MATDDVMTIEVKGLENIQRASEGVAAKLADGSLVARAALEIERQAKINASGRPGPRVQTGRLRSSITIEVIDANKARVGTNVVYAPLLEFGMGKKRHRYPFLYPTIDQVGDKIKDVVLIFGHELGSTWGRG